MRTEGKVTVRRGPARPALHLLGHAPPRPDAPDDEPSACVCEDVDLVIPQKWAWVVLAAAAVLILRG